MDSHLERYQISPHSGLICGLDLVIKMIKNDVIDELVPSKDLRHLTDPPLANFNPITEK